MSGNLGGLLRWISGLKEQKPTVGAFTFKPRPMPPAPPPTPADTSPFNTSKDPSKNKWLVIRQGVLRTDRTDPIIAALDEYFYDAKLVQYVTSVKRTEHEQLDLIIRYAKNEGLPVDFNDTAVHQTIETPDGTLFVWQLTYSLLLTKGIKINPPIPCKCLTSSIRGDGTDRKGSIIGASEHITSDRVFDIGGYDPADPTITNEVAIVKLAVAGGVQIISITPERKNNCTHVKVL